MVNMHDLNNCWPCPVLAIGQHLFLSVHWKHVCLVQPWERTRRIARDGRGCGTYRNKNSWNLTQNKVISHCKLPLVMKYWIYKVCSLSQYLTPPFEFPRWYSISALYTIQFRNAEVAYDASSRWLSMLRKESRWISPSIPDVALPP